jgi:hypothetical protein
MEFQRHHVIAAIVAIVTAIAFLLWFAPQLGFLAR